MENIHDLWERVLSEMETKVSKPSFETWLKSTKATAIQNDVITVTAPNEFARDWLEDHYAGLTSDTIEHLTGSRLTPKFVIPQNDNEDDLLVEQAPKKIPQADATDDISSRT
ncbi:DnaA N-terminal domain-containing protein, partial [Alkalihalobacillus sp. FSL R5-0424]